MADGSTSISPLHNVGKCHQRIIRETKERDAAAENLFGAWWGEIDTDIGRAKVMEISLSAARSLILEYEYLGTMSNGSKLAYGIFWEGSLAGCVIYGAVSPPSVIKSIFPRDNDIKVIQLSRGACVHWAHKHSASKLISFSLRQVRQKGFDAVVAYSDPRAGEIGTVYQASNWIYCGLTAMRHNHLDAGGNVIMGPVGKVKPWMVRQPRPRKARYIYLLGKGRRKKKLLAALAWGREAYPKRQAKLSSEEKEPNA